LRLNRMARRATGHRRAAEPEVPANMTRTVRPARTDDADDISRVIVRALRETNSKDYSPEIIVRVERSFEPRSGR
jgi:hypothetical protein